MRENCSSIRIYINDYVRLQGRTLSESVASTAPKEMPSDWSSDSVNVRSECWNVGVALLRVTNTRTIVVACSDVISLL